MQTCYAPKLMFSENGYYCSAVIESGFVSAKRGGSVKLLPHPTMSAFNFIRNWVTALLLSPYRLLHPVYPRLLSQRPATGKKKRMPKYYEDDEAWADIEPLAQDDGGLHPLAAIAYTEEYSQAMGYLRAVMAKNEFSERVLKLTEHIISMNPAHYTVW